MASLSLGVLHDTCLNLHASEEPFACLFDSTFHFFQGQPTYTFRVSFDMRTRELLDLALAKLSVTFVMDQPAENYVLKVSGTNTCYPTIDFLNIEY